MARPQPLDPARLLALARQGAEKAREALAGMDPREQAALVCEAPLAQRADLVELLPAPERVIPALPPAELCFTAKAIGLADAGLLLRHAPCNGRALADPVCRCEEVELAAIDAALAAGATSLAAIKRATRAGMGRCQGRYCGPLLAGLLHERTGRALDEFAFFAPRPPVRPVPIGAIATAEESP